MSPARRIIAAGVQRLRDYLRAGGRPYLLPSGKLSISTLAPEHWGRGSRADQAERERAVVAFHRATKHDLGLAIITRAIRLAGIRRPHGYVIMKVAS